MRAARIAARYKHRVPEALPQLVEDEFGFKIDPVVARAIRDLVGKCGSLVAELRYTRKIRFEEPPAEKIADYERLLRERDRQIETIAVPETYNWPDLQSDDLRVKEIRDLAKSRGKPGPDDDAEEAYLIARTEAYRACPRHRAWCRISELELSRAEGDPLTEVKLHELDDLCARFPAVAKHFAGRNWSHYRFYTSGFSHAAPFSARSKTPEEMTPDEMERRKRRPEADRERDERWCSYIRRLGAREFREKPVKVFRIMESSERQRSEQQNPEQKPK